MVQLIRNDKSLDLRLCSPSGEYLLSLYEFTNKNGPSCLSILDSIQAREIQPKIEWTLVQPATNKQKV